MENLLDLTDQVENQPVEAAPLILEAVETESTIQPLAELENESLTSLNDIEEIDTAPAAEAAKVTPGKSVTKPAPYKRKEPPPNPLLLDPYEWDVR